MDSTSTSLLGELLAQSTALNPPDRISWHSWREMVGSKIAQRSKPAAREGNTLTIVVASPLWANELSLLQTTILKRVQSKLPGVQSLRFQIGRIEPGREAPVQPRIEPAALPPDLEQRLLGLEDTHLRETIRAAAAHQLAVARLRSIQQPRVQRPAAAPLRRSTPPSATGPKSGR